MTHKAGLIGVGGVGRHHGSAYNDADGVELVAVADLDAELLAECGEEWGVPPEHRYESHEMMLASEGLDVVSVATPTVFHRDHVLAAVESETTPNVVWCEKPIATSVTDAEEMVEACDERGVELVVNHSRRWAPELPELRKAVAGGALGDVQSASAHWPRELLRNATHCVDLFYHLLDADVIRVSGYLSGEQGQTDQGAPIEVDDVGGGGHIVCADDTLVTLDATLPRETSTTTMEFVGSGGKLRLDLGNEVRYWAATEGRGGYEEREPPVTWESGFSDWFVGAAENVVDLLDGAAENASPGREAVDVLEILVGIFISHYTGGHIELPLDRPLRDVEIRTW